MVATLRNKYKPAPHDRELVRIWTDGSCNNKTKTKGSYGIVIVTPTERREYKGPRYEQSTSARMEVLGAIKALEKVSGECSVRLYCDNQYCVNLLAQNWLYTWDLDNDELKNIDLLRRMKKVLAKFKHGDVKFIWLRGHNGDPNNERCDELAGLGANRTDEASFIIDTRTL